MKTPNEIIDKLFPKKQGQITYSSPRAIDLSTDEGKKAFQEAVPEIGGGLNLQKGEKLKYIESFEVTVGIEARSGGGGLAPRNPTKRVYSVIEVNGQHKKVRINELLPYLEGTSADFKAQEHQKEWNTIQDLMKDPNILAVKGSMLERADALEGAGELEVAHASGKLARTVREFTPLGGGAPQDQIVNRYFLFKKSA